MFKLFHRILLNLKNQQLYKSIQIIQYKLISYTVDEHVSVSGLYFQIVFHTVCMSSTSFHELFVYVE